MWSYQVSIEVHLNKHSSEYLLTLSLPEMKTQNYGKKEIDF